MVQVEEVKRKNHFQGRFKEPCKKRPILEGVPFKQLSHEVSMGLEVLFLIKEVEDVIWSGVGGKSLGTYGFNLSFYKACWEILKGDIMRFMNVIDWNSKVPKAVNASF